MNRISKLTASLFRSEHAGIGIGTMIIFIAMILVAGIAASVIIQTVSDVQRNAMRVGGETLQGIANGIEVVQVTGYVVNSKIDQLAILVRPLAGSGSLDLSRSYITLSDQQKYVVLKYNSSCFSRNGDEIFSAINSSALSANEFGILVIRDYDNSCKASSPIINDDDLVAMIVNATKSFSGIPTRTQVKGEVVPEEGVRGIIDFFTPSVFIRKVVDLQP